MDQGSSRKEDSLEADFRVPVAQKPKYTYVIQYHLEEDKVTVFVAQYKARGLKMLGVLAVVENYNGRWYEEGGGFHAYDSAEDAAERLLAVWLK